MLMEQTDTVRASGRDKTSPHGLFAIPQQLNYLWGQGSNQKLVAIRATDYERADVFDPSRTYPVILTGGYEIAADRIVAHEYLQVIDLETGQLVHEYDLKHLATFEDVDPRLYDNSGAPFRVIHVNGISGFFDGTGERTGSQDWPDGSSLFL
jgi:hypothetical protein